MSSTPASATPDDQPDPLDRILSGVQHRAAGDRWCCAALTLADRQRLAAAGSTCSPGRCGDVAYWEHLLSLTPDEPDEPTR